MNDITFPWDADQNTYNVTNVKPLITEDSGTQKDDDTTLINFGDGLNVVLDSNGEITVNSVSGQDSYFIPVPRAEMDNDTWSVGAKFRIPDSEEWDIESAGVQNDAGNVPVGLKIQMYDTTNSTLIVDENSIFASGAPLATVTGPVDVEVRVENSTGSKQAASGFVRIQ